MASLTLTFARTASASSIIHASRLTSRPIALAALTIGVRDTVIPRKQVRYTTSTSNFNPKTQSISPSESHKILAAQRLNRPTSPHLGIYKWQVTSVNSSLERITGVALSGSLYIFGIAYVASPYLGWDLSSNALAATMAGLPLAGKIAVKFGLSWPFFFHGFNGLRYLAWDMTKGFNMTTVYRTGYASAGLSVLAATGFAIWS